MGGGVRPSISYLGAARIGLELARLYQAPRESPDPELAETMERTARYLEAGNPWVEPWSISEDASVASQLGLMIVMHRPWTAPNKTANGSMSALIQDIAWRLLNDRVQRGSSPAVLRKLILRIDQMLVHDETRMFLSRYAGEIKEVERVLFRHPVKTAGHFIGQLSHGPVGVVTKLKGRWRYHEGALDDALAVLPREIFDLAVPRIEV
jgi:hypothetical protein